MQKLIKYFAGRHILTNFIYLFILCGGLVFWNTTRKEELPEIAADFVMIRVGYPGASPEEVERLVTWPIEKELHNVDGIEDLLSTSSEGAGSITAELQEGLKNRDNIVSEIRNTVLSVNLPAEIIDPPSIHEFKNTKKAVIDLGIYFPGKKYLSVQDRKKLQRVAHTIENRLINLPQISSINKRGYLKEEMQILIDPDKLYRYHLSVRNVISVIKKANVRQPAGSLENASEERVTLDGEIISRSEMENLPVQGSFEGPLIRLGDIAIIKEEFEDVRNVFKINGREGVFFSVVKNANRGILESVDAIKREVSIFQKQTGQQSEVSIIFFDDESKDVRNRINIIKGNGLIGFILIVSCLFIFLNFRAGFWVATAIPFTFSFTLIMANLLGYTINNVTLAAVIIVMGMVVDDAIIVSENVIRLQSLGIPRNRAIIEGTVYVLLPITASILTTCVAFFPLWAFEGRITMFLKPIPVIVSLMLVSSLIESILILPAHLALDIPRPLRIIFSLGIILIIEKYFARTRTSRNQNNLDKHSGTRLVREWFTTIEKLYIKVLSYLLRFAPLIVLFFAACTIFAGIVMSKFMKFELFPREEVSEVRIRADAPAGTRSYQTARMAEELENIFLPYLGKDVAGMVTYIGMRHFRTTGQENAIWIRIELRKKNERKKSFKQLATEWRPAMKKIKLLKDVHFSRRRFGMSSGSPVEIIIQENDNALRKKVTAALIKKMENNPVLTNIQTGESYNSPEYSFLIKRDLLQRFGIDAEEVGVLLRSVLEGVVLYRFLVGDEEKDVRLSVLPRYKHELQQILKIPVNNSTGHLVPLAELVSIHKSSKPLEINRINRQRITRVNSDFQPDAAITPLEIGEYLERKVFPELGDISPHAIFSFDGEIKLTRESTGSLPVAIILVLALIYSILALQFQSLMRPLLILFTIPPTLAAVIFVFLLHGIEVYGLFGIIGSLGLAGVVVNDAIILIKKLDDTMEGEKRLAGLSYRALAEVASTRVKAVLLTTLTTVVGLFPTAYGILGYDSMLAEMMLVLTWGLIFGTGVTLVLIPALYKILMSIEKLYRSDSG